MTRRGRHEYDLMRCEPSEFVTVESLLRPGDIEDLEYPSDRDLARVPVRGLYLANYYPWDSRLYSEEMISRYGAKCARNRRTFDTYDRIDDCTYMTVHDVLKFARIGYSRVTDSLCREIRFGRISRQDALSVQAHFQAEYPLEEAGVFSRWLGLTPDGFSWLLGQMAHPSREQTARLPLASGQLEFVRSFQVNSAPVWETESYIIYGKGLHV